MRPSTDRGKTRQLAAQIAKLFLDRRRSGNERFGDINSKSIDDFYYENIDFEVADPDAQRLVEILDKLTDIMRRSHHPKMRAHDAIHLILFVDALWDDYTRSWEGALIDALEKFSKKLLASKLTSSEGEADEYWLRYGQWTRVNSDRGDTIRRRHEFYIQKMSEFLGPLTLKDSRRAFGGLERELIYLRDKKLCQVCGVSVPWSEAEIHHVLEHASGGKTELENGVLVHQHCHPKGKAAKEFTAKFSESR
jgi:5-methylcytosine-specific restriction endonuclease McrA